MIIIKRLISIILCILTAVSVLLCSSATAFADTTVDTDILNVNYFKENVFTYDTTIQSLSALPSDDYLTFVSITHNSSNKSNVNCFFVPQSKRKIVYLGNIEQLTTTVSDDTLYLYYNGTQKYFYLSFTGPYYQLLKSANGTVFDLTINPVKTDKIYNTISLCNTHHYGSNPDCIYINNANIVDSILSVPGYRPIDQLLSSVTYAANVNGLFSIITQIIPGYTGSIKDNSLNGLISEYGKDCDTSILKQFKYQITYCQNNDIKIMFLNNNKAPKFTSTDYNGVYPIARKYSFTYENSYDAIVYFPQYQKYLNYDDWYNNKPEPNDFNWFWENDNKSFSLINDWTVTFNEGAPNYSGTRVIIGWEKSFNAASASMSEAWKIDKDKLINEGWIEGRPNDQNYPYQITIKQNSVPTFQIYMNSKPVIEVDRNNQYQCLYKIQMVPQCGYVYSFWADCYSKFDYTTNLVDGNDIISQGQNYVWNALNTLGAYYDDRCMLHLAENFRGSTDPESNEYIGTKVFFNWDISSKMINKNDNDDYDYSQLVNTGDKYVDNNGNIHGGSLNNYDSEDLNKYNDNGSSNNNSASSGNFDFTLEGITSYCSDFFNFLKSVFNLFPSFIWVLVGAFIAVLIALRVLGR